MRKSPQVTIFGGAGFIGRYIVQRLAQRGAVVRVPTRDMERALALKPAGDVGQIVPFLCPIRNEAALARAIAGSDCVINLIGILHESGRDTFPSIHLETAARIARIASQQGVKDFVHISALGASTQSASRYSRTKAAGEDAVRAFFPQAIIMRPALVFGPEDNFFNRFASLARFAPFLPLIGGGRNKMQPVYVGDVADAVIAALGLPHARGQSFELAGPTVYSFRELMELTLRESNRALPLIGVPYGVAALLAGFAQLLPNPAITRDQVELLKTDNITGGKLPGLAELGLSPTALELILPAYLATYRAGGQFAEAAG